MKEMTRRRFIRETAAIPLFAGLLLGADATAAQEVGPRLERRERQPYVGIRAVTNMQDIGPTVSRLFPEVRAWLDRKGIRTAGAPFIRYLVIDMEKRLELEVCWPVARTVAGNSRVHAGALPAGRYAVLTYTGAPSELVKANADLQAWAKSQHIRFKMHETRHGSVWAARVEFSLTNPPEQPDMSKWQTEIAYLVADRP